MNKKIDIIEDLNITFRVMIVYQFSSELFRIMIT